MITAPYHGIHVAIAKPDATALQWLKPQPRCTRIRVREHTCECRTRIYELCQAGGLFFVRRTDRTQQRPQVMETEWLPSTRGKELWNKIISGQAI